MAAITNDKTSYNLIQKRLQDEGEWERIYLHLSEQLNEAGWLDELYDSTKERTRADRIPIRDLLTQVGPSSKGSIPADVKAKALAMIQESIEKMLQK